MARPEFQVTKAKREKVAMLKCVGMSNAEIAGAMGCDRHTLEKHFADDLSAGRARKRAEIIGMLEKSAKAGNVSAQKKLEEMSRLAGAEAAAMGEEPVKLGKKEIAQQAAETAGVGTEWGDDLNVEGQRPN